MVRFQLSTYVNVLLNPSQGERKIDYVACFFVKTLSVLPRIIYC
jgi:hypothetical protein